MTSKDQSFEAELALFIGENREDRVAALGFEMGQKITDILYKEQDYAHTAFEYSIKKIGEALGLEGVASFDMLITSSLERGIQLGRKIERGEI